MPRPATKRNRLAAKPLDNSKPKQSHNLSRGVAPSRDISCSPRNDAVGSSQLAHSADPSEIIRQLRNQTPLGKSQEFAIGSSPGTDQRATGSRPPTRARGYSSTLSIAGRKGDTSSRIPGTPAFESSILSNFRRRPRQASILHMMQDEGSSDYDDDDFLGGLSPEDESTPLNITRGKSLVLRPAVSSPAKSPLPSSGKSSKRKRSIDAEGPLSPLAVASSGPSSPASHSDIPERETSTIPPPSCPSPATFSETMAPPLSSPVPDLTREMSTPVPDRTPVRLGRSRIPKTRKAPENEPSVPTAALQDQLLPRRRQRRAARKGASGFEVVTDSDEDHSQANEDDDELSFLPMRNRSQTRRKPASKSKPKSGGKGHKVIKQYGTNGREDTNVDKENELELAGMSSPLSSALDSDAFDSDFLLEQEAPVKNYLSEELRLQALKFAEVDKWQMEFEDVITVQENGEFR
ncbi:hypothetical protein BJX63DRAFT_287030 [Aspergillus granulosus]|uniref:Uncharacterized protein n=1 Tax=Aspergillus granulosus TaxID=176169 RepID=A0ABR4H759_9EURO